MNIYVRYFDHEALFRTAEEVVEFLRNLNDFEVTPEIENAVPLHSQLRNIAKFFELFDWNDK